MKKQAEFSIPFTKIKDDVLGKPYELSLVFCDSKDSRDLNRIYRSKDKPGNVLAFPLSENFGEIFIDLELAEKECVKFEKTFPEFVLFLFIHGLLHLKGMEHGSTMEKNEKHLFNIWREKFEPALI